MDDEVKRVDSDPSSRAYVRPMTLDDLEEAVRVQTRAMANDPSWNFIQHVKARLQTVPYDVERSPESALGRDEQLRSMIMRAFTKAVLKVGQPTVCVVSAKDTTGEAMTLRPGRNEKVVGVALWMAPGHRLNPTDINLLLTCGFISVIRRIGWTGIKRTFLNYKPAIDDMTEKAFKARKVKNPDSNAWYIASLDVDPDYQGRGYSKLLMTPILELATRSNPPLHVHLEASTVFCKGIYERLGFETVGNFHAGNGIVDADGVAATGERATGIDAWVMIKWAPTSLPPRP